MGDTATVTLPGGLWLDGVRYQEATLRALTGDDEAFLLEAGASLLPAQKVTALLARCLARLGPLDAVSPETARALTVGDREALLLHLRRLTLGDRLPCVLTCAACGEKLDLELAASDLLLPPYAEAREYHEFTVAEGDAAYRVRFRLPTGGDQETVAALAASDLPAAAGQVLRCCVESVVVAGDGESPLAEWPTAVAERLPPLMAQLDAQAELVVDLDCPACGHAFSAVFDTASYFFRELAAQARRLYLEVHWLAFYYHWSEAEIMGMTASKRRRYLALLEEALGGEGGA